jgi:hypothetical protein
MRIAALCSLGVALATAAHGETLHAAGFHVDVPPGFQLSKSSGPDFDVYRVVRGETAYVGVYVGFAPDFPSDKTETVTTEHGVKIGAELIDGVRTPSEWLLPAKGHFIHVWAIRLNAKDREMVEAIARSVGVDAP